MKVGRRPEEDPLRVRMAREAIGPGAELFGDANGGYSPKQALRHAEAFANLGVTWLLFDGVPQPVRGILRPDVSRPGLGLELKRTDTSRYAAQATAARHVSRAGSQRGAPRQH